MKSWWLWRKPKPLLKLFSGRVPWPDETPDSKTPVLLPFDERPGKPHPKNAPGGFYVVHTECTACGVPHHVASDVIEMGERF